MPRTPLLPPIASPVGHGEYGLRSGLRDYATLIQDSAREQHVFVELRPTILLDLGFQLYQTNVYAAALTKNVQTFDGVVLEVVGIRTTMESFRRVESIADCAATPGSYYYDAGADTGKRWDAAGASWDSGNWDSTAFVYCNPAYVADLLAGPVVAQLGFFVSTHAVVQPILGADKLVDGSFEQGLGVVWSTNTAGAGFTATRNTVTVIDGIGSLKLASAGSATGQAEAFVDAQAVIAGNPYCLDGYYLTDPGVFGASFRAHVVIADSGGDINRVQGDDGRSYSGAQVVLTPTEGEWRRFCFYYLARTASERIKFGLDSTSAGTAGAVYFDGCRHRPVYRWVFFTPRLSAEGVPPYEEGRQDIYWAEWTIGSGSVRLANGSKALLETLGGVAVSGIITALTPRYLEHLIGRFEWVNGEALVRFGGRFSRGGEEIPFDGLQTGMLGRMAEPTIEAAGSFATLELEDQRAVFDTSLPTRFYDLDAFSNMDPRQVGRPRSLLLGTKANISPARIDFTYRDRTLFNLRPNAESSDPDHANDFNIAVGLGSKWDVLNSESDDWYLEPNSGANYQGFKFPYIDGDQSRVVISYSVTVRVWAPDATASGQIRVDLGANNTLSAVFALPNQAFLEQTVTLTNPNGGPWTVADINAAQPALRLNWGGGTKPRWHKLIVSDLVASSPINSSDDFGIYEVADTTDAPAGIQAVSAVYAYEDEESAGNQDTTRRVTLRTDQYSVDLTKGRFSIVADARVVVITPDNQNADFIRNGVTYAAKVPLGAYVIGQGAGQSSQQYGLLKALADAMNAAAGVSTITAEYLGPDNTPQHRVKISHGGISGSLLCQTGVNAQSSIWPILGFDVSNDKTAALTYTSENPWFTKADENHFLRCDAIGYADDASGTYTGTSGKTIEKAAEVLYFLLARVLKIPTDRINVASFVTGRTAMPQALGIYLGALQGGSPSDSSVPFSQVISAIETSVVADLYLDGEQFRFAARNDATLQGTIIDLFERDFIGGLKSWQSARDVYGSVAVEYDQDPSVGSWKRISKALPRAQLQYGRLEERIFSTYLRQPADAQRLSESLGLMAIRPKRMYEFTVSGRLLRHHISQRVRLTPQQGGMADETGNFYLITARILHLTHNLQDGLTTATAVEES